MESKLYNGAYGKIANAYDAFLTFTGFRRGIEHFLDRQPLVLPARPRILDAGCGTGLIALYLARRFPEAEIHALDIDPEMLREMARVAARGGIHPDRLTIAAGDLSSPDRMRDIRSGRLLTIPENHFDAIITSGALEHVPLAPTVQRLARLLKPGGEFLNLALRKNPAGAILGMMYDCRPYTLAEMRAACVQAGLIEIRILRLAAEDFPANLSRVAIMAKKR